jgi:hypothetical protein
MLLSKFKPPQKTGLKVLFFGEGVCNGKAIVGMEMDSIPHMKTVELHGDSSAWERVYIMSLINPVACSYPVANLLGYCPDFDIL